jgi:alkanesulfonate monooxygenase SsuD/methylene tetrahydromethanopterin reductase-like flavin-dependent oxidoreductase (luciferase family)
VAPTLADITERKANIDAACAKAGREPIPFTVMTGCVLGTDQADYEARVADLKAWSGSDPDPETQIVGTLEQAVARLREYEAAGVSRIYLQHLVHRDIAMVELIGRELVPAVA